MTSVIIDDETLFQLPEKRFTKELNNTLVLVILTIQFIQFILKYLFPIIITSTFRRRHIYLFNTSIL